MSLLDPQGMLSEVLPAGRHAFERLARDFEQETGLDLKVRSARRTCAHQDELYASGRTEPGDVVTYARGCQSWHVLGLAIDAEPFDEFGKLVGGCETYTVAGEIWEDMGGTWGGRFAGFGSCGDAGHFEWHPGASISEVCRDPNDCVEAVALAEEMFPARAALAKIAGSTLFLGGLAVVAYMVFRR